MSVRKLHIVLPALADAGGHEIPYTENLVAAARARGLDASISIPADAPPAFGAQPVQRFQAPREKQVVQGSLFGGLAARLRAKARAAALGNILARADDETLTIVHTAGIADMLIAAHAAAHVKGETALLIRYDHYDDAAAIAALKATASVARENGVRLLTDSADLAEDFAALTGSAFAVAGPSVTGIAPAGAVRTVDADRPVFGFFGGARPGKGFAKLPAIVDAITRALPGARFIAQAYIHRDDGGPAAPPPAIAAAIAALRKRSSVELVEEVVVDARYRALFERCDAVVLPYDSAGYRRVTSGVFVEALASGRGALVARESWMAKEAARAGLSRAAAVDFDDADAVATAAAGVIPALARPCPSIDAWAPAHSYDALLSAFLGGPLS